MAIRMATFDDSTMEPGKFYLLHVNLDNANALVEVNNDDPRKIPFVDARYIEVDYSTSIPPSLDIYETIYDEGGVLKCDLIQLKQSIREEGTNRKIILESNRPITGFIVER